MQRTRKFKTFAYLTIALVALPFFASGCNREKKVVGGADSKLEEHSSLPDVILISIDTLRADHLGCYGHELSDTTNIDAIASSGVRFQQAFTTIPVTLPAHSSMMTGQIPPVHGVRDNGGDQLAASAETLAEVLKSKGYQTGAFVGAEPLKRDRGLAQGFDVYDDLRAVDPSGKRFSQRPDRPAEIVAAQATGWIHTRDKDRPLFAFIHFFDPHWPYEKPLPGQEKASYLGEIAHVDRVIGQMLKSIDADRDAKNRILVLTSDHGEGLGEHNEKTHCIFVYDSTLRVPLILCAPAIESAIIDQPVGVIDIAPTILDLVGVEGLDAADGISLVTAAESGKAEIRDLYFESRYGEFRFGWAPLKGVRRNTIKFIDAPDAEIFDTANDPGETKNLFAQQKELAQQLKDVLATIGNGIRTKTELSDESIRKLANLGYVSAKTGIKNSGAGPDPKDKIEVYNQFQSAYQRYLAGAKDEALIIMAGLEKSLSESSQFYFEYAYFQTETQDWEAAERSYRRCLELEPDYPKTRQNLATVLIQMKKFEEARKELEILLAQEPDNGVAHLYAGFCAKELSENAKAIEHWRKFVFLAPHHPDHQKIKKAIGMK